MSEQSLLDQLKTELKKHFKVVEVNRMSKVYHIYTGKEKAENKTEVSKTELAEKSIEEILRIKFKI